MIKMVEAGNAKTNDNRGTVTFAKSLKGMPSKYAVLVTASSALAAPSGAHVCGYNLDANDDLQGFEVYTDEAIADFSWIVVEL